MINWLYEYAATLLSQCIKTVKYFDVVMRLYPLMILNSVAIFIIYHAPLAKTCFTSVSSDIVPVNDDGSLK